jgi:hypothetical protein
VGHADHPNTLTSIANLASTLREQGRWEEAEQLFTHVIAASSHRPCSRNVDARWAMLVSVEGWSAPSFVLLVSMDMAAMSRKQRMKIGGAEDEDTLDSTVMLGEAYVCSRNVDARWAMLVSVEGWSAPSFVLLVSITCVKRARRNSAPTILTR